MWNLPKMHVEPHVARSPPLPMACGLRKGRGMKTNPQLRHPGLAPGKAGWILLWLIGVPVPLLLVFFLLRGCT